MSDWTEKQVSQIKAILSCTYVGADGWMDRQLPPGKHAEDVEYEEVFSVSVNDVHRYVEQYGWDTRVVKEIPELPSDPEEVSWDLRFFVLPPLRRVWTCGRRQDMERRSSPYQLWSFVSKSEMDYFIINDLVGTQRGFWGKRTRL